MRKRSHYFFSALLSINIILAVYFISGWLSSASTVSAIPGHVMTENRVVRAEMLKLSGASQNKQIAVALASSRASICVENKIVDFFKRIRSEKPQIKLHILFPSNMSDQDISTFKDNLALDFDILRMSTELQDYWESISKEYGSEAIIVVGNKNDLVASQNLSEIKSMIDSY